MSDMPTRRIIPGIYPFCSLLLCGEQRVSSHSHYLCFKLLCMHSQSKQAIVVLLNGCTSGSQGSPGYERNVLLFQQASVMLLCWEPWPSVRQPPEANVRALRSYRLTITAGTQSLNRDATSACPNLRPPPSSSYRSCGTSTGSCIWTGTSAVPLRLKGGYSVYSSR